MHGPWQLAAYLQGPRVVDLLARAIACDDATAVPAALLWANSLATGGGAAAGGEAVRPEQRGGDRGRVVASDGAGEEVNNARPLQVGRQLPRAVHRLQQELSEQPAIKEPPGIEPALPFRLAPVLSDVAMFWRGALLTRLLPRSLQITLERIHT